MKNSLKKLKGLTTIRHSHEKRDRRLRQNLAQLDELVVASQDMQDMKDCYDKLLSAAAATTNSAYEFSESLREMGDCLLEKTALNDDEEGGQVLLMLGKVQFELQKLVDIYRSHISRTITNPSESLLNELRIVEEMKRRCDEKREIYEDMVKRYREKGRLRSSKGECFSSHQLQVARDEYEEEANVFVFRMKSLKKGQSRSLLTQAARHHAAQLSFFKKALKSLEAIEPHVKMVSEKQHIDYQFSAFEDDDRDEVGYDDYEDEEDDDESCSDANDDGELSFDYRRNDQAPDVPKSENFMELDNVDVTFPQVSKTDTTKENMDIHFGEIPFGLAKILKPSSKSAPLFPEKKVDSSDRLPQLRPSASRKFHSYVLPTPIETKSTVSAKFDAEFPEARRTSSSDVKPNLWHSSPLDQNIYKKLVSNERLSGPIVSRTHSILKESNNKTKFSQLPPPLTDGLLSPPFGRDATADIKKVKRQAFSGPITGKPWPNKPIVSASGPIVSTGYPQSLSGSQVHVPLSRPSSTSKLSSASHAFVSSPKISELHELPRPPANMASLRPLNRIAHSGPLISKSHELSTTTRSMASTAASTLPTPPQSIIRSYSIPSRGQLEMDLDVPKPLEGIQNSEMAYDDSSPPMTPVSLKNDQSL